MKNPRTGKDESFTPQEVLRFAEYGMVSLDKDTQEEKDPENVDEKSDSERIDELNVRIKGMEEKTENDKRVVEITSKLDKAALKYDITKNNPKLTEKLNIVTLARIQANPRLNVEEVFAQEVADMMDIDKVKEEATKAIKAASTTTVRGGGLPIVDTEIEYKADALKDGTAKRAMQKYLESIEA